MNFRNILGIVEFNNGKKSLKSLINNNIPYLSVNVKPLIQDPYIEIWVSEGTVKYFSNGSLHMACDGENLFGAGSFSEENYKLDELSKTVYNSIFHNINQQGYPNLYRIWNFVPDLNCNIPHNIERYKLYCNGRSESFSNNHKFDKEKHFPAATCMGSLPGNTDIYFLSSSLPDYIHIENMRQTPSYNYPSSGNLNPPCFARATYYKRKNNKFNIYISGTSSVVGHKTLYANDIKEQCITTLENIEILLSQNNLSNYNINGKFSLKDIKCIKVYIRNITDLPVVKNICEKSFSSDASIVYLKGDICRTDLLVEIEGIVGN